MPVAEPQVIGDTFFSEAEELVVHAWLAESNIDRDARLGGGTDRRITFQGIVRICPPARADLGKGDFGVRLWHGAVIGAVWFPTDADFSREIAALRRAAAVFGVPIDTWARGAEGSRWATRWERDIWCAAKRGWPLPLSPRGLWPAAATET